MRLGKERVEVLTILRTLAGESNAWKNHPCVKMWKGHEKYLINYGLSVCLEWIYRGYKDTCFSKINRYTLIFYKSTKPKWLGNKKFHDSHKSNLLRKNEEYYSKFNWRVRNDLPYYWP